MKKSIRKGSISFVIAAAFLVTGCGAASNQESVITTESGSYEETYDSAAEESVEEVAEEKAEGTTESGMENYAESQRKLIKTMYIDLETLEYEKTIRYIEKKVNELEGYIESSALEGSSIYSDYDRRYGELKVRIPKKKSDGFIKALEENANVSRKSENTEDITLNYIDVASHKEALKVEQERLMSILEKAETVEEIIALESRLSEVRYELGNYESTLRTYDNLVDYTTINISVTEVQEITEAPKLGAVERMTGGFLESIKDIGKDIKEFIISFVIAIPYLVVWGIVIAFILIVIRAIRRYRTKKRKGISEERKISKNDEK